MEDPRKLLRHVEKDSSVVSTSNTQQQQQQRLQSLKFPRDLNLAAAAAAAGLVKPKRQPIQVAPNVNVVRNKDKIKDAFKKLEQKRKEKAANVLEREHKRRDNKDGRFVQTEGTFSQGFASLPSTSAAGAASTSGRGFTNRTPGGGGGGGGGGGYRAKRVTFGDEEQPEVFNKYTSKHREDHDMSRFDDYEDQEIGTVFNFPLHRDLAANGDPLKPITLAGLSLKDSTKAPAVKTEVKLEPKADLDGDVAMLVEDSNGSTNTSTMTAEMTKLEPKVMTCKKLLPAPFDQPELYNFHEPALALVKLPDSLAGKNFADDTGEEQDKNLSDYPLDGMVEGRIGKLVIRKSGRIEAKIGNVNYVLEAESTCDVKEQLTMLVNKETEGKAQIVVLGDILKNYTMYPDYMSILD